MKGVVEGSSFKHVSNVVKVSVCIVVPVKYWRTENIGGLSSLEMVA